MLHRDLSLPLSENVPCTPNFVLIILTHWGWIFPHYVYLWVRLPPPSYKKKLHNAIEYKFWQKERSLALDDDFLIIYFVNVSPTSSWDMLNFQNCNQSLFIIINWWVCSPNRFINHLWLMAVVNFIQKWKIKIQ